MICSVIVKPMDFFNCFSLCTLLLFYRILNSLKKESTFAAGSLNHHCGSCCSRTRPNVHPPAQSQCAGHDDIFAQAVPDRLWQHLHHNGASDNPQHEVNLNRQQPGSEPILVGSL